jgi:energy-coupling factor transporter ATP-binding protein EcfA2
MIVVAHDMPMILGLVDRLYVMASGEVIAEGRPAAVARDPVVIAAYLGTSALPVRPSAPRPPAGSRSRSRSRSRSLAGGS